MPRSTFGPTFNFNIDGDRIRRQHERIRDLMLDDHWRSLSEISTQLGYPESSVSAQLRHLRKFQFGEYTVNKRRRLDKFGDALGSWEYQVRKPPPVGQLALF